MVLFEPPNSINFTRNLCSLSSHLKPHSYHLWLIFDFVLTFFKAGKCSGKIKFLSVTHPDKNKTFRSQKDLEKVTHALDCCNSCEQKFALELISRSCYLSTKHWITLPPPHRSQIYWNHTPLPVLLDYLIGTLSYPTIQNKFLLNSLNILVVFYTLCLSMVCLCATTVFCYVWWCISECVAQQFGQLSLF